MPKRYALKRWWICALGVIALLAVLFLRNQPRIVETWFSRGIYRVVSLVGNHLTGWLPFSVAEWMVYGGVLFVLFAVGRLIYRLIKEKDRGFRIYVFFTNLLCTISILWFAFVLTGGLNYYRIPLVQQMGLEVKAREVTELTEVCRELAQEANFSRTQVEEDENGVMKLSGQAFSKAKQAMENLQESYSFWQNGYTGPKSILWSRGLSHLGITGIFFPFTLEANVNTDVPDYEIPYTACHELTHLRGFMREEEANFAAFLGCMGSEDPDVHYSGALMALSYCMNALYSADSAAYEEVFSMLSDGIIRDLQADNAYWRSVEGTLTKVSSAVNDAYLKANAQEQGTRSYGAVVDLILAYYQQ